MTDRPVDPQTHGLSPTSSGAMSRPTPRPADTSSSQVGFRCVGRLA
jgi:hypothetical protein